jgi:penicillin-binding protein 1A
MNIIAVKTMIEAGIDNCFDYLVKFGFTTLVDGQDINGMTFTDRTASLALAHLSDDLARNSRKTRKTTQETA